MLSLYNCISSKIEEVLILDCWWALHQNMRMLQEGALLIPTADIELTIWRIKPVEVAWPHLHGNVHIMLNPWVAKNANCINPLRFHLTIPQAKWHRILALHSTEAYDIACPSCAKIKYKQITAYIWTWWWNKNSPADASLPCLQSLPTAFLIASSIFHSTYPSFSFSLHLTPLFLARLHEPTQSLFHVFTQSCFTAAETTALHVQAMLGACTCNFNPQDIHHLRFASSDPMGYSAFVWWKWYSKSERTGSPPWTSTLSACRAGCM